MSKVEGFPPIYSADSEVLILGSMPGVKSLEAAQYYAHPRNAFWPIMQALFDIPMVDDFEERYQMLLANKVALWDVLQACERQGSLDAAILTASEQVNDFEWLFEQCPNIQTVYLNGGKASRAFKKYVLNYDRFDVRNCIDLPSTSPAYAAMGFAEKLSRWSVIKASLNI